MLQGQSMDLSVGQKAFWLAYVASEEKNAYQVNFAWNILSKFDETAFNLAVNHVMDCHPLLRAAFSEDVQGNPKLTYVKSEDFAIEQVSLNEDVQLTDIFHYYSHNSLDLERGETFRFRLLRRDKNPDILFFSVHHIIIDMWSIALFFDELSSAYRHHQCGHELRTSVSFSSLPTYDEFVRKELSRTGGKKYENAKSFWHNKLSHAEPILNVPTSYARPPAINYHGDRKSILLDNILAGKIDCLTNALEVNRYSFFLSMFQILLSRYAQQDSISVLTPTSLRRPKDAHTIGYYVNPVIVVSHLSSTSKANEFIQHNHLNIRESLFNQTYPFLNLIEDIGSGMDKSRGKIAQATFSLYDPQYFLNGDHLDVDLTEEGKELWSLGEIKLERHELRAQNDDSDLFLTLANFNGRYQLVLEYNSSLFSSQFADNFLMHLVKLIDSVVADPECELKSLNYLSNSEVLMLKKVGGLTRAKCEAEQPTAIQLFEKMVDCHPEKIAVYHKNDTITYDLLNKKANCLANHLISSGIQRSTLVGVALDRTIDMLVTIIAIVKAGAAYVPLDPTQPAERLAYIFETADLSYIITQSKHTEKLPAADHQLLIDKVSLADRLDNPTVSISTSDLIYCIFTSGSTGKPKGVLVEQKGINALIEFAQDTFPPHVLKNVLASTSLSFDIHVFETWVPLALGASITLIDSPLALFEHPLKSKVTFINTVPSAAQALLDLGGLPTNVRALVLAGEPLSRKLVDELYLSSELEMVFNLYGPTEDTVYSTYYLAHANANHEPYIGRPIPGCYLCVLDNHFRPLPIGVPGELYLNGSGLARGYHARADLTSDRFVYLDPFDTGSKTRMYRTGDIVRILSCGHIEYIGRNDYQVKIRGHRIEIEEINSALRCLDSVAEVVTTTFENNEKLRSLVTYLVLKESHNPSLTVSELRTHLRSKLPEYMIPSEFRFLDRLPLNTNGKVDIKALPAIEVNTVHQTVNNKNSSEKSLLQKVRSVWEQVLGNSSINNDDNFFDIGGTSLNLVKVNKLLIENYKIKARVSDLFKYPTISAITRFLEQSMAKRKVKPTRKPLGCHGFSKDAQIKIAVIGIGCRFPEASSPDEYWENIIEKRSGLKRWSTREILTSGRKEEITKEDNFIPISGAIDGVDLFDAKFFSMMPREAQITDPQHRIFLECAWQAIEDAGLDPDNRKERIGIYAGAGESHYYKEFISHNQTLKDLVGKYATFIGNEKDFLSSRVAYFLNTRGPAVSIQSACSTSLYAVHMACIGLLNDDCNVALAGGVSLGDLKKGYSYEEGMVFSSDGHCRSFDHKASGTVPSQGCGVVVLKRLDDAVAAGDRVYATIVGSAVTNDGSNKVGFSAPSAEAQSQAIIQSMLRAKLTSDQLTLIEAHGTATKYGDPVELEGLKKAFQEIDEMAYGNALNNNNHQNKKPYCAIGSVKSNIGHTDTAAGIAGLIKAVKALDQKVLPPSLDYEMPNSSCEFDDSPFYVNNKLREWETGSERRYAGVSSFGMGGTNAHVSLEEFIPRQRKANYERENVFPLTAKNKESLLEIAARLKNFLRDKPSDANYLSDLAYTLQVGRKNFKESSFLVSDSVSDLVNQLDDQRILIENSRVKQDESVLLMMFSGQGSQYQGMAKQLYQSLPDYKSLVDDLIYVFRSRYPDEYIDYEESDLLARNQSVNETQVSQISLFILEYSIAKLFNRYGIEPHVMIGHSVGEYVAACLAGVFDVADAMFLLVRRGKLIQSLPKGSMISVKMTESEVSAYLEENQLSHAVDIAVINSTNRCSLSGESSTLEALKDSLLNDGFDARLVCVSHAFHSFMLEPILESFREDLESVSKHPPSIPLLSNVTGTWLTDSEATSSDYWVTHLRQTNRFADGLSVLFNEETKLCCLEIGPGKSLSTFVRQHKDYPEGCTVINSLPGPKDITGDIQQLFQSIGRLWQAGIDIDWRSLHQNDPQKTALPSYPLNKQSYWLKPEDNHNKRDVNDSDSTQSKKENNGQSHCPLRDKLVAIWQSFLSLDEIDEHLDFFSLGGDSLSALRLIKHINESLNLSLGSNALIQYPTISRLCDHIKVSPSLADFSDHIVRLHSGTSGNLFLIHPIGVAGHLYFYRDLIQAWQPDVNIYGLSPRGYDGKEAALDNIEDIAALYMDDIRKIQPKGPYLLGGASFGGLVAYELSQIFKRKGEEVAFLFMVDTPSPKQIKPVSSITDMLVYLLHQIPLDAGKLVKLEKDPEMLVAEIKKVAEKHQLQAHIPPDFNLHYLQSTRAYFNALTSYDPEAYEGDIVYFKAIEEMHNFPSYCEMGWIRLAKKGVNLYSIPGNHVTMNYNQNARRIASYIQRELGDRLN